MQINDLQKLILLALEEDCPKGDITVDLLQVNNSPAQARIIAKAEGIFYGTEIINTCFELLDPFARIVIFKNNGSHVQPNDIICEIHSNSETILKIERTLLNFLQRLSGIATITNTFVKKLDDPNIQILDTRKTTPLLRFLEKRAVVGGGGFNHRHSLSDMALLKENHLIQLRNNNKLTNFKELLINFKKKYPQVKIEVEIEHVNELKEIDLSEVDIIMFDEFPFAEIEKGLQICHEKNYSAEIEISGNISLENIHLYKNLPIQRISIGSLTHSIKALDLSLICF